MATIVLDPPLSQPDDQPSRPPRRSSRSTGAVGACRFIPWRPPAIQAGLSLRLLWSNTAFAHEALYPGAGHLQRAHGCTDPRCLRLRPISQALR